MGQRVPNYARVINFSLISVKRYRDLQHLIAILDCMHGDERNSVRSFAVTIFSPMNYNC